MIRKTVTLYDDQYKFFKSFKSEKLLVAFVEFMFEDIEPKGLNEQEQVIFDSLRTRMENQKKKALAGGNSHGGGRPKKQQKNNTKTTEQTTEKQEDKDKDKDKEEDKDIKKEKIIKKKFLDFVQLSDDEYQKLVEKFGQRGVDEKIDKLNNYIGSTGKRYKSHYFTILSWSKNDPGGNKDYEREKQKELHNQKIMKQFLDSQSNGNESNGNQTGGYNRRNDIGFSEVSG